ncbi:ATP phosphoribosyltransferase [Niveomyces insectorum RCEF 264]|uniref:ATP phosphoribosyltransferase n=1 Tax=Niveomyces insectorum RCEF 264 TaxID=1081102 RepID=A0A167RWQ0_9HYPO|nr:ATP phosphoribosyltransferase [Niveomyces insectorum RCEF 264]
MDLVNSLGGRLLFAIPKKGRLQQAALDLLRGADIQFRRENRLDIALVKNLPLALVFLPAADIPTFVGEGRVDLGITGYDQVQEHDANVRAVGRARSASVGPDAAAAAAAVAAGAGAGAGATPAPTMPKGCETVMELGFGDCKLQVQVPEKGSYAEPSDLIGKNIGTSFVHLAEEYFARLEQAQDGAAAAAAPLTPRKLRTKIVELSGSVEAACALGVADGIVDLVESGETMKAAGLKPIDTVVESTAILIKSKTPSNPELVDLIASRIGGVITAQKYVLCLYNVPRSQLTAAVAITPGKRAPTITSLDEANWVAVSAMVEHKKVATVMDELVKVGATDIIVLDIHNTRSS